MLLLCVTVLNKSIPRRSPGNLLACLSGEDDLRTAGISRRQVIRGAAAAATTAKLGAPSVHAQNDGPTLRFVAEAALRVLDPVWTTAYITRNHSYLVYDTLFGTDENLQIKPQLVDRVTVSADGTKYTFTLRDG